MRFRCFCVGFLGKALKNIFWESCKYWGSCFHPFSTAHLNTPFLCCDPNIYLLPLLFVKTFFFSGLIVYIFLSGPIPASFCLFSLFSRYNFKNTNWKKHRWIVWDSNPGPQDGRCRWYHGAMAATLVYILSSPLSKQPIFGRHANWRNVMRWCVILPGRPSGLPICQSQSNHDSALHHIAAFFLALNTQLSIVAWE